MIGKEIKRVVGVRRAIDLREEMAIGPREEMAIDLRRTTIVNLGTFQTVVVIIFPMKFFNLSRIEFTRATKRISLMSRGQRRIFYFPLRWTCLCAYGTLRKFQNVFVHFNIR